ncbi:ribose 5-phosphate isomerase A [Flavihumibacter profundi]|uniref:ribose 5-phosphate isomerase A n=1 Tax=Flavihumibacter profundi TaxID=2716883 RepID=UPI001CC3FF87|nr:ribose 5-phosphate isomerase A [Flavihumibacter profundi]MBZ5856916.1 ribose 5-phosphate isomerase A [Flavihumibacter profundi]
MDLKKEAAIKAISFIKGKSKIGLGAGSTIAHIVNFLAMDMVAGQELSLFTSSFTTHQLLLEKGFSVRHTGDIAELDIYFDGCDQVDKDLNAVKSGGGIHTREKLLASMAQLFILVGDQAKYTSRFDVKYPLVIEVLPEALFFVPYQVHKLFPGARVSQRMSDRTDGAVITFNGNYLLDVWFTEWPEPGPINQSVKLITGVVETSLFYNLAQKAIIAYNEGVIVHEKPIG